MIEAYLQHEAERQAQGIPALPLNPEQAKGLCELLVNPPAGKEEFLLNLLKERISPGVDPAAEVKADFLGQIIKGEVSSPLVSKVEAVQILGTMMGGYNIKYLIEALQIAELADEAACALSGMVLIYDAFDDVDALRKAGNAAAAKVVESWAAAEWFTSKPELAEKITVKVYKVDGEINTDDFSPAGDAWSRPDIPLHSLAMGKTMFPEGNAQIAQWRAEGHQVAFVGDVVGTGSSRKSACNSVLWHIGEDIPAVPNKRRAGVIIGGVIAPIFFNTAQDSGALPLRMNVDNFNSGDVITIDTKAGKVFGEDGAELSTFEIAPSTVSDEFRAGGRTPLIIGRKLTERACEALGKPAPTMFIEADNPVPKAGQQFSLAQKMVGKACGVEGILPGTACEPKMTTVGSQDTTGPMTADEIKELACLKFQSPMVMQSFCHTAAYPKPADVKMHNTLPAFIAEREGVALRPGDGVIHSWLNRLLLPDTVGTGGDSHTRFPIGISFPAGSGLIAFAGALGFMALDMPESVLVRFKGEFNEGITLRDAVNAIPYWAIKQGLLTVPKKNKVNIFNGRILEMEGLPNLSVEQAYELTDAAAERSAAAGCIQLSEESVCTYLRSNVALMESMIRDGYQHAGTLQKRIDAVNEWLKNPQLLKADKDAEYAAVIEIDLSEITEPILACPNDPDDVKLLSEVQGTKIQDIFLGSCMTNIGHFRAAAKIWEGNKFNPNDRVWICPPTRMDQAKLKDEALFAIFNQVGARIETPGCSLCMGNQARVPDGVNMFSTSTRNFNDRIGNGAQVYLGGAELGAVVALKGELPTPEEYLAIYKEKIAPCKEEVYNYLQFDELGEFDAVYKRCDI
ncbi:bifunctional aconitate hydratase 2/2-methylisocitrate dehydratase [uncultured Desulfuromonas sp.]|uniref:bifunctional aconitate hydratase 2/2-methylisocitrate dehydratase n=1 Tax=uncultured Desulfuromonas sp. TaxID=181013 RepID=UPI002AAAC521|nr:bifunctional aconitate hydratase 2/2-methylisocitrate dehydratase [uncultured Desulfuromonas sp.]